LGLSIYAVSTFVEITSASLIPLTAEAIVTISPLLSLGQPGGTGMIEGK